MGTAQRVVLKNGGGKVVLAQACILIKTDISTIINPVNTCYEYHQQTERVRSEAHTCLTQHTEQQDSVEGYFQNLIKAFS
ncbi:hypothetical protein [Pseudoalteromonas phenolica]|uniref:hypothetical protein n=1 Tax=Pseudoalteromonas phenolica TaxID=161398 RepID=UPI0030C7D7CB